MQPVITKSISILFFLRLERLQKYLFSVLIWLFCLFFTAALQWQKVKLGSLKLRITSDFPLLLHMGHWLCCFISSGRLCRESGFEAAVHTFSCGWIWIFRSCFGLFFMFSKCSLMSKVMLSFTRWAWEATSLDMDYLERILHDVQCIMSFSPPQREVKRHLEGIKPGNQYERRGSSRFKMPHMRSGREQN